MVNGRRWEYAIHFGPNGSGEVASFKDFWAKRLEQRRNILIVTGLGWDPRMTVFPELLRGIGGDGLRDLQLIRYRPSENFQSPYENFLDKNISKITSIMKGWGNLQDVNIITRKDNYLYVGDRKVSDFYLKADLSGYTDIIVDISALTKSLYFTLLLMLVERHDRQYPNVNVHVVACQDVELDSRIIESADDPRFLKGFTGSFNTLSKQRLTKIWAPLLERNYSSSLRKLYDKVSPTDVYPILPFPSRNPRTDDDLLLEYRDIFVDEWNLNPMNIIYAVEDDPLDVYRILLNLLDRQNKVLEPLGGVAMAVSALSSKLSSIGAFMAAFEGDLGIPHAIGRHDPPSNLDTYWSEESFVRFKKNLHSIWLTGEPYD